MKNISFKKRIASFLTGVVMLFNFSPFEVISEGEPTWENMPAGLKWNEDEQVWETETANGIFGNYTFTAYWDPVSKAIDYTWDATKNEDKDSKEVKIVFTFNNTKDTDEVWLTDTAATCTDTDLYSKYPDIWFDIPGIADARRGQKQDAVIGKNSSDFSCDEYEVTDAEGDGGHAVYKLVSDIQTLNGGMEIVWDYNPRLLIDGYTKELHPSAYLKVYDDNTRASYHVVKVNLTPMHFAFESERDNIAVDIKEEYQDDFDSGVFDNSYTWKRISTEFDAYAKTRPLQSAEYTVELKKEDIDAFVSANANSTDTVYLKINGEYVNINDTSRVTENDDYYVIHLNDDNAFKKLLDFSQSTDTHATNTKEWKGADASNIYIGIKNTAIENRVGEIRLKMAKDDALLPSSATVDEYYRYHNAGSKSAIDLSVVPAETLALVKTYHNINDTDWNNLSIDEKQEKVYLYGKYVVNQIDTKLLNAVKLRFKDASPGKSWDSLDVVTQNQYIYDYKYGSLDNYKISLDVQSHIVRACSVSLQKSKKVIS